MSNIVKGVVMNNKYLMLYNEYLLNNMYRLTNSNNRARANYKGGSDGSGACCDDCDGSCVSSSDSRHFGNGYDGKYKQVNIFSNALALPRPSALAFPKLCSDNIHNDCICL